MDKVVVKASKRDVIGKHVKNLRHEGLLPAVIYGKEIEPVVISLDLIETTKILRSVGRSTLVIVDVDGKEYSTLVRDRQRDFIKGHYLHVDFLAVSLTETVRTLVNIFLTGVAPALEDYGALLSTAVDRVEVEALPQDLPDSISVDISGLAEIGNAIYVRDIVFPEGVECLSDLSDLVVAASAQVIEEEEEELLEGEEELEEGAEPEVIGEDKGEEDED